MSSRVKAASVPRLTPGQSFLARGIFIAMFLLPIYAAATGGAMKDHGAPTTSVSKPAKG